MGEPMNHDDAKQVLFEVADVLDAAGVPFFLMCGTALGAYRDGRFIEGDGDIDLGMLIEDFQPKAGVIAAELQKRGFKVQEIAKPWDFCRALKIEKDDIHVDLCGWMLHGEERFLCSSLKDYALVHSVYQIDNAEMVIFLCRKFFLPCAAAIYLEAEYGPDWRTPLPPEKRTGSFHSKNRVYGYLKKRGITP